MTLGGLKVTPWKLKIKAWTSKLRWMAQNDAWELKMVPGGCLHKGGGYFRALI